MPRAHPGLAGLWWGQRCIKYGVGGVIIGENEACIPTVFRYQWPDDIMQDVVSEVNPTGRLTNSDLEMAGLLLLWLIMEEV